MALYYAEHDAQPDVYTSIPATLWWAVVTLTTVGYGDAYPVTILGRMVASVIMLVGIGLVAVPTSLLSAAMTDAAAGGRMVRRCGAASSQLRCPRTLGVAGASCAGLRKTLRT